MTLQPVWRSGFDDVANNQAEQFVCGHKLAPPARDEVFQTPNQGVWGRIAAQLDDVRTSAGILRLGAEVRVPAFVSEGDKVRVDTRTGEYVDRG